MSDDGGEEVTCTGECGPSTAACLIAGVSVMAAFVSVAACYELKKIRRESRGGLLKKLSVDVHGR